MVQAVAVGFEEERARGDGSEGWPDVVSWRRAHDELVRLAATRAGLDYEEGRWLLRALRAGVHLRLGYGSFREYAGRLFGYSPRLTQEKIRVAEALEALPELSGTRRCKQRAAGRGRGRKDPRGSHVGAYRATQAVPPALRRSVLRRDEGRCRVPGCRHAVFTDVHHIRLRSEGGVNCLENLLTLCSAHHRSIHRGELCTEGTASNGLLFLHADGTPYGGAPSARDAELWAKAYRALTRMGYRETETKRALARISANSNLTLEQLIRLTLRELDSGSAPPQGLGRRGGRR